MLTVKSMTVNICCAVVLTTLPTPLKGPREVPVPRRDLVRPTSLGEVSKPIEEGSLLHLGVSHGDRYSLVFLRRRAPVSPDKVPSRSLTKLIDRHSETFFSLLISITIGRLIAPKNLFSPR